MNHQQIAALAQEEKYRKQIELMRQIYSIKGFYRYYFDQLPKHRTQFEAFNAVNDLHFELFGQYRYDNFESFSRALSYHRKNNNL